MKKTKRKTTTITISKEIHTKALNSLPKGRAQHPKGPKLGLLRWIEILIEKGLEQVGV